MAELKILLLLLQWLLLLLCRWDGNMLPTAVFVLFSCCCCCCCCCCFCCCCCCCSSNICCCCCSRSRCCIRCWGLKSLARGPAAAAAAGDSKWPVSLGWASPQAEGCCRERVSRSTMRPATAATSTPCNSSSACDTLTTPNGVYRHLGEQQQQQQQQQQRQAMLLLNKQQRQHL